MNPFAGLLCLLRGCIAMEFRFGSLGLHCFLRLSDALCVTLRKEHQPGITPDDNITHVPTAGSSAALTKPNHTPTGHPPDALCRCLRRSLAYVAFYCLCNTIS